MALEDILRTMEEEAEKNRKEILSRGEEQAERIVGKARQEAEGIKETQLGRMTAAAVSEEAKILNEARLYLKKEVIHTKEKLIEKAFREAAAELKSLRKSPRYAKIFRELAEETLRDAGDLVTVVVDSQDKDLALQVLEEKGIKYQLDTSPNALGGLKVVTADGRITLTNTLGSRLEKARQFLKPEVTTLLFG